MKSVLVTGASGFIGRHCLPLLRACGYEVHAVRNRREAFPVPDVTWHAADLQDEAQLRSLVAQVRPTHLLHLAWDVVHGAFWTSTENLSWVRATLQLLQEFTGTAGRRAVLVGSCAEYDWRHGYCVEELTPLAPASLFGASKHAVQLVASAFAARQALTLAWARIFFAYGPHENPLRLVPSVVRSLLQGQAADCTHGKQMRDFLFVEDIAAALVAVLDSDLVGPINIASGSPLAVRELALQIGALLDRPDLIRLGRLPARPDDPPLVVGDVRRLTEELSWTPRYSLVEGLEKTIHWWRAQREESVR